MGVERDGLVALSYDVDYQAVDVAALARTTEEILGGEESNNNGELESTVLEET